jgi:hypothetical protein
LNVTTHPYNLGSGLVARCGSFPGPGQKGRGMDPKIVAAMGPSPRLRPELFEDQHTAKALVERLRKQITER